MRRIIRESGIIVITICINCKNNTISAEPQISAPGLLDEKKDQAIIEIIRKQVVISLKKFLLKNQSNNLLDTEQIKKTIRNITRILIKKETGKQVQTIINIAKTK